MSILKVDTINEKTSGNGVVIPSGQTLDVSAGTFVPSAGQVVQELVTRITSNTSFSSNSYTDASGFALTITPKYASSKIIISMWAKTGMNNTSINAGQDYRILRDSTVIESASWQNYLNRADYSADLYPPLDGIFMDEPNTTSATLYKLQGRKYGGADSSWGTDGCGGSTNYFFSVKELKQ
tara:strand:- start:883 stop:1425 length:543 start_codon:yes stop_codon:yes gene_type:complete